MPRGKAGVVGAITPPRSRPAPPWAAIDDASGGFVPAPDVESWIRDTFLTEYESRLYNPDHEHLAGAHIAVLWTNKDNRRHSQWVLATAEDPNPTQGGAWKKGRAELQLRDWFGEIPDFLITLHASLRDFSDRDFCAVIEHELYHCGHALNDLGHPKFHLDGTPVFGIRGHDVENFIGVVRRYGPVGDTRLLIEAAKEAPQISDSLVNWACGTCHARVAA